MAPAPIDPRPSDSSRFRSHTIAATTEGEVNFDVPGAGKPCKTWYRLRGNLTYGGRPLVCLHGGPGVGHDYLESLEDLSISYNIPVVLYDQLGTGRSTHLPEKKGDAKFWTIGLFLAELDNLLRHLGIHQNYDLYGNSWGGMLGAEHAILGPKGLNRLIIADAPASMHMWVRAANKLRKELPEDVQAALQKHEDDKTTDDPEYERAVQVFYQRHVCRVNPWPKEVQRSFQNIKDDPTVYHTMNGPSEFHVVGSLKEWSILQDLPKIDVPTLLINGRYDEATDEVVEPYFQKIKKVKWVTFEQSSHMPHVEERSRFMEVVSHFLRSETMRC
ncbi:hypothetical protein H2201_004172 [Coniosporium apollinis]|uniref:AB hydrolase-1 domain-containing protein n=2 Tax=Coniosporium TaxID=2810619 RepID=A0ABQ9NVD1_9PEZI|nr:hypothetical protein H2199_007228 [Cladosporium sp. JES 115]KAJ9665688.1 hypothetical protein H2201_004172 [Coniosporium apollinis]